MSAREEVIAILRHLVELQDAIRAYERGEFDISATEAAELRAELHQYETRPLTKAQADLIRETEQTRIEMLAYLEQVPCGTPQ